MITNDSDPSSQTSTKAEKSQVESVGENAVGRGGGGGLC